MTTPPPSAVRVAASPGAEPLVRVRVPDPCVLVLFGATGDLARRKIVPALYDLALAKALPEKFALVGFARSAESDERLRALLREGLERFVRQAPVDERVWERFARGVHALPGSVDDARSYAALGELLGRVDAQHGTAGNRLFYCATPPSAFPPILRMLDGAGLVRGRAARTGEQGWARVVVEKPFGRDLESARELNRIALQTLDERQVYRIDHYLGKETVQNILAFRFGNSIFEPLWNRSHIDHVQITMAESIGVEGRGRFYEEIGVLRDVVQNHLLQVLALCAMEPPVSFEADEIRNMKAQVLRSLRVLEEHEMDTRVVRAQYHGYRKEEGVFSDSQTPTFVALEAWVDNWRWQGVPFYLRAGKALARRMTEVAFHFRAIPHCLFGDERACQIVPQNVLKLRIQPDEGIALEIASKVPGEDLQLGRVALDFRYAEAFERRSMDAYERLLLDCMRGDPTLFARDDEVELSWRFCAPILAAWERASPRSLAQYEPGGEGPREADELLSQAGRRWVRIKA